VGEITDPDKSGGVVQPGHAISRLNGVSIAGFSFNGVIAMIQQLPRPVIVHFIQPIIGMGSEQAGEFASASVSIRSFKSTNQAKEPFTKET
jgi:hypothetical protein